MSGRELSALGFNRDDPKRTRISLHFAQEGIEQPSRASVVTGIVDIHTDRVGVTANSKRMDTLTPHVLGSKSLLGRF